MQVLPVGDRGPLEGDQGGELAGVVVLVGVLLLGASQADRCSAMSSKPAGGCPFWIAPIMIPKAASMSFGVPERISSAIFGLVQRTALIERHRQQSHHDA